MSCVFILSFVTNAFDCVIDLWLFYLETSDGGMRQGGKCSNKKKMTKTNPKKKEKKSSDFPENLSHLMLSLATTQ